ncbi:MAG TPA: outer membrane beta-barrel protein [Thermoanaerobaculia bacterium]|nr:outer membrane beta-barrel protein [Thermoanaerobaculia bacterium]
MKRSWWVSGALFALLAAAALPAEAQPHGHYEHYGNQQSVRLRLGLFTPDGDSDFFDDTARDFTGDAQDFEDLVAGGDYVFEMHRHVGIMLSGDYFEGHQDQSYRNFEDNQGNRISHTSTLDISPLTAGIVVRLAPDEFPVKPYVGAGGGLYVWRYEESGDFIDFGGIIRPVFTDTLEDDGAALGYYLMAGLEVPISPYFSLFAEGRWDRADDELGGDFADLGTLDLSGRRVMGGIAWHF